MKNVVLLGDSIRMNYQEYVKELLGTGFEVGIPEENGRYSRYMLNSLRMSKKLLNEADIIHWNNGLWDIAVIYKEDGCFTPLDEYLRDMKRILRELKKTGAKIIYATTTPVNPLHETRKDFTRSNADIDRYNAALLAEIGGEVDAVNDLNAVVRPHIDTYITTKDYVHLTDEGKKACAEAVAKAIKAFAE